MYALKCEIHLIPLCTHCMLILLYVIKYTQNTVTFFVFNEERKNNVEGMNKQMKVAVGKGQIQLLH